MCDEYQNLISLIRFTINFISIVNVKSTAANKSQKTKTRKDIDNDVPDDESGDDNNEGENRKNIPQKKDSADSGHIMISYQWANQKSLIKIRDELKKNGYNVWMDIDQMGGSTLAAMADAVERASVVLVCMSQKYKDSPNCRAGNDKAQLMKYCICVVGLKCSCITIQ